MANTFKRFLSRGIGTSATSVGSYVVAASTQTTLIGLSVANISASAVSITVALYDGTNSTHLIKDAPLLAGSTLIIAGGDQKIVMQTGDSIRVTSTAVASVDAIISVLEVT